MSKKLHKEVCKKCYEENGWVWTGENENEWNKKDQIRCIGYIDKYGIEPVILNITLECNLDKCLYKLEHIILSQHEEIMDKEYTMDEIKLKFLSANKGKSDCEGQEPVVNSVPLWTLGCQNKFNFDGSIIEVDSRFYPPSYNTREGGGYGGGSVDIMCGGKILKKKYFKPRENIDDLINDVEKYVNKTIQKIEEAVKGILNEDS